MSHDVDLLTHGFWGSSLEGYSASFQPITVGNNVILGWKTIVLPGVSINNDVVVGANSTVVKSLTSAGLHAGNPCTWKHFISPLTPEQREQKILEIQQTFLDLLAYYDVDKCKLVVDDPYVQINDLRINLNTHECVGDHDHITDAYRDHLRRYGIRVFHPRGFKFTLQRLNEIVSGV